MGRPCFLRALLVSFFLFLLFSHGFGRTLKSTTVQDEADSDSASVHVKESGGESRVLVEVMDYEQPVANTNPRGIIISPPPN